MEKDELQEYLNALGRDDCYRVEAVLKDSPRERTERVYFVGNNGSELGPFIRKTIVNGSGQGRAYEKIYQAQQAGKRFVHLPRIFEYYLTDSSLTVLIEFIQGSTLQEYVEEQGASVELALRVFPQICDAVEELHKAFEPPIVHRDLTPANIIVSVESVSIIDFGIARTFHPGADHDTTYFGTRAYAPPEQFGFGQTDVRSDVYALGKVLHYCLCGEEESTVEENTTTDECLAGIVTKATQFDPDLRFQSVSALKAAFLQVFTQVGLSESSTGDSANLVGNSVVDSERLANPAPPANPMVPVNPAPPVNLANPVDPANHVSPPQTASAPFVAPIVQHPAQTVQEVKPAKENAGLLSKIPTELGIAWDVIVAITLLLFFAGATANVIYPEGSAEFHPLWFRALEYYGMIIVPMVIIAYYLIDLRPLRRRFPSRTFPSRRKTWPFALLIIFALVIAIVAIANIWALPTLS